MKGLSKKIAALGSFLMELLLYGALVVAYFLLVLHLLGDWIKQVFDLNKTHYAFLAVGLITVQGVVLERLTSLLMWVVPGTKAILLELYRLSRPHETVTRPAQVPGLVVYRFASPLLFFNAAYFSRRVRELVETTKPRVNFFLVNAEAIVDMDMNAVEVLAGLHHHLKRKRIVLGICNAKGHFRKVLLSSRLHTQAGFNLYPSVAAVIRELSKKK